MASSTQNMLLYGFSGKLGNMVIKKYKDKIVLSAKPDMSNRVLTEAQKEQNEHMKFANEYARRIMADPELKAEACRRFLLQPQKIYRALIKDFMLNKGDLEKLTMTID